MERQTIKKFLASPAVRFGSVLFLVPAIISIPFLVRKARQKLRLYLEDRRLAEKVAAAEHMPCQAVLRELRALEKR